MKIAVVSDDKETISAHFGRAEYYVIFTVEDNKIVEKEIQAKPNHRHFAGGEQVHLHESHDHEHHDHDHEHHGHDDPRGHGFGKNAGKRHTSMIEPIQDCDILIVRGMGRGAHQALENAGIRPMLTDIKNAEAAVQAHIDGTLTDHPERLH